MTDPEGTTQVVEADAEGADPDVEVQLHNSVDDSEELEDVSVDPAGDSPEVAEAKEAYLAAEAAFKAARAQEEKDRLISAYRELPEAQREGFLTTAVGATKEDDFVAEVEAIERAELIEGLVAGNDEALIAAYKDGDDILGAEIEDALTGDPDRLRKVLSEVRVPVVEAPVQEPGEDGFQPEPIDWGAFRAESALAEVTDAGQYAAQGLADVRTGKVKVDADLRDQLEELVARADSLPPNHSHRTAALQAAAGLTEYIRSEHERSVPFGLGGINKVQYFTGPDGRDMLREFDGRGKVRVSVVEGGKAPSELGLLNEVASDGTEDFDPASVKTLADARRLTPPQWAKFSAGLSDEEREALLRQDSAEKAELEPQMRQGRL